MTTHRVHSISMIMLLALTSLPANAMAQESQGTAAKTATPDTMSFIVPAAGVDVPMDNPQGRPACPAVEVTVNGHGPYRFLIETGATISIVSSAVAQAVGLQGPTIDSIGIGSARLRHLDIQTGDLGVEGADGLLGLGAYKDLLLTLDFPHHRVQFKRGALPAANGHDVFTLQPTGAGQLSIDMEAAGKKVSGMLDTQNPGDFLETPSISDSTTFVKPPATIGTMQGPYVEESVMREGRLRGDIRIGDAVFDRPLVTIATMPASVSQYWNIGATVLREFVMTLDERHNLVRLVKPTPTHVAAPPPLVKTGWDVSRQGGNCVVNYLAPGGEAEHQGIQLGDVLVSIGGRPIASVNDSTLDAMSTRNQSFQVVVRRGTETKQFTLTPRVLIP